MKILGVCKALHVKRGYVLRGYLYVSGLNANGVVWALPIDGEFPPPDTSPQKNPLGTPPRPPAALDNMMDAVEGDQSPWSYLCASILCRELQEFGAVWHGIRWGHHIVLGADPFKIGVPAASGKPPRRETLPTEKWTWSAAQPTDWMPQVRLEQQRVIVTFYTYSGSAPEGIYRHVDTYELGSYRFDTSVTTIATGPGGYLY
jgi:hypothetical protein